MACVLGPLGAFELAELLGQGLAQRAANHLVALQRVDGLAQALWQHRDAALANLGQRELEQVFGTRRAGVEPAVDAVEPGCNQRGGGQVRVGRCIGQAPLEAALQSANQGGAVVRPMRHTGGCPGGARDRLARHQPFVAVDRGRGQRAQRGRVLQHTADEVQRQRRQIAGAVIEDALRVSAFTFPQRHMKVHAAAGLVGERLGHHREHHAVALGQLVRGQLEQHQVIGAGQRVGVVKVQLVLALRVFVVDLQNVEPAGCQPVAELPQELALARQAFEVVRRLGQSVERVGGLEAAGGAAQQKELGFDAGAQCPAALGQPRDLAAQHLARAGVEGLAGHKTVAHDACIAGQPGQGAHGVCVASAVVLRARAGAWQAGAPDGRAGKADAVTKQQVQLVERHELAARHAVQVGELGDEGVNALGGE